MKTRIDKGFCVNYWSLSYRRKFLRTVWFGGLTTVGVLVLPRSYLFFDLIPRNVLLLALPVACAFQAVYNYRRWKAEPGAPPNGGPAESLGNLGAGGGPPSVS